MSEPERHRRIGELFRAACRLPREARAPFLDEACADDEELRNEVLALLAEDDRPSDFPGKPAAGSARQREAVANVGRPPPERVGRYRIVREIGRGGMGVVYEAEQESPRRTIAVKLIDMTNASGDVLRRFEREAEMLGRLQHPGIAQIFEADTFDAGAGPQPFIAMELVRGEPLQEYIRRRAPNTRERLDLIAKLCDAVHHAHQQGVIHRDLKPANILVDAGSQATPPAGVRGWDPQPKVLDFGVARATASDVEMVTLRTDLGQLVGTVPYMSPEQASGDPQAIDTRSDVYALGVIAYELLAGRLPYDLDGKLIHEAVRVIREDETVPLSSINRTLAGDVETIVGKALAKDKVQRYQSASDLGADIRRYLNDEPVIARRPSTWYQFRKFARRNKPVVAAAATVFIVLVAAVAAISAALVQVRSERDAAGAALAQARTERDLANAVRGFLAESIGSVNPFAGGGGQSLLMRDVLDRAAANVGRRFADRPAVEAEIRDVIGRAYLNLALFDEAGEHLSRALTLRERHLGGNDLRTLDTVASLARLDLDRGRLDDALTRYQRALAGRMERLGEGHPETLDVMGDIASVQAWLGRLDEAEATNRRLLALHTERSGQDSRDTLISGHNLALVCYRQGRNDEAAAMLDDLLPLMRNVLGVDNSHTQICINTLGNLRYDAGRFDEAEALYREGLESALRTAGEDHQIVVALTSNLAEISLHRGRYDEAEAMFSEALAKSRRLWPNGRGFTSIILGNLGETHTRAERYEEAEVALLEAHELHRRYAENQHLAETLGRLVDLYDAWGRADEAAQWRTALEAHESGSQ